MRIIQLHSENIKRLKAVDITPSDNVVVISGMNENGKTSVLDSIWLALQYRAASKNNPSPLRAGEDKGLVTLDLGDYIVTRKFTDGGSTLEIKTPEGSRITSPQTLLDGMIGDLSFDPWEFSRKSEEDQRQMLADVLYSITDGKLDLAGYDQRHKESFDARTEANREKKRLVTLLTTMRPPTKDDPTDEVSADQLTKSIADAVEDRAKISSIVSAEARLATEIKEYEAKLASLKKEHDVAVGFLSAAPEVPDIDLLKGELSSIEERNRRAREVQQYQKTRAALDLVDKSIEDLNNSMELIEIEKAEALEASPLPVKGLQIAPEGILILNEEDQPVPFCQASAAKRLKISLAIAMAANAKLRVIRISDGSLLDDDSMAIIKSMADKEDYQVWLEYASRNDQDRIGVYIQDGMIAN